MEKPEKTMEKPGKNQKHETEIAIRNKAKKLNDESMILAIGNYNFREGPDFVAKEVHYLHGCRKKKIKKINPIIHLFL